MHLLLAENLSRQLALYGIWVSDAPEQQSRFNTCAMLIAALHHLLLEERGCVASVAFVPAQKSHS